MEEIECKSCPYANKDAGFCGFCLRKIIREVEEERRRKSDGQRENSSTK